MKKYYISYSWSKFSASGFGSIIKECDHLSVEILLSLPKEISEMMKEEYDEVNIIILNFVELQNNEKCTWQIDHIDETYPYIYQTSCDNAFGINERLIDDHEFKFCPYCGKEIEKLNK